jgi:phospholipid-transporting ATPase
MLTGDREETAVNIAVACNLVLPSQYMDQIVVNNTSAPDLRRMRELFENEIERYESETQGTDCLSGMKTYFSSDSLLPDKTGKVGPKSRALIIDGPSLHMALNDEDTKAVLLALSTRCSAVVACRVTPDQKRAMVNLIKKGVPGVRTLAIGDGANDVAMIQEAHVGVGIRGEEGVQAVNASDFAIAQFRFISVLILKHGRYNYVRMSQLVRYMFYKNILMSMAQFWFNFNNAWSGQKYYTEGAIQLFNLAYTALPIILLAIYDMDISPETVLKYPQLYKACINNEYFNTKVFWCTILEALFESVILSIPPLYYLSDSSPLEGDLCMSMCIGIFIYKYTCMYVFTYVHIYIQIYIYLYTHINNVIGGTFWEAGATCFTCVVIVVNFKIFFMQTRWTVIHLFIVIFSILFWFLSAYFINSFISLDFNFFQVSHIYVYTNAYICTCV